MELPTRVDDSSRLQGQWLDDLRQAAPARVSWLWHGYLARDNVTVLTSQWKSGKTTLLSVLLSKMESGGELAGFAVAPGKAAVVSEESPTQWLQRTEKLALGHGICWFCRPFLRKPRPAQWQSLVDRLGELHAVHRFSLVAIDSLAGFLPRGENDAGAVLEFLAPLQQLATQGLAVLVSHHPRKKEAGEGMMARGSGALSGFADVLIEMRWAGTPAEENRRRRLLAFSRHEETPRQLVIELNAAGIDYLAHGNFQEEEFARHWQILRAALETAPRKLKRPEIRRRWPRDREPPSGPTLWRWLESAVARDLLRREGTGQKSDPFRYWLPGRDAELQRPEWQRDLEELNQRIMVLGAAETPNQPPASP